MESCCESLFFFYFQDNTTDYKEMSFLAVEGVVNQTHTVESGGGGGPRWCGHRGIRSPWVFNPPLPHPHLFSSLPVGWRRAATPLLLLLSPSLLEFFLSFPAWRLFFQSALTCRRDPWLCSPASLQTNKQTKKTLKEKPRKTGTGRAVVAVSIAWQQGLFYFERKSGATWRLSGASVQHKLFTLKRNYYTVGLSSPHTFFFLYDNLSFLIFLTDCSERHFEQK